MTREKLDRLWHEGIFYEPANCTMEEIVAMEDYASEHQLSLYTRDEFIRKILHRNHFVKYAANWQDRLREPCYVIGHNLPFDLGSLAIHCGLAEKDLYGGLSLVLSGGEHDELVIGKDGTLKQKFEYRVAVKKLGFGKCMYRDGKQINGSLINEAVKVRPRRMELVHYLDTMIMGRAELGPGPTSMRDLLRRLNVPKEFQKGTADYHGPITPEYIGYCRDDVENTWQMFKAERELYLKHGRSKLMHHLYSEASMGKAYLEDIGVESFNERNPHFDPHVLGCFMESNYGGRSGVRVRHLIVEVVYCDFKSQYPTCNALMQLQRFLIASAIGVHRDRKEAFDFLKGVPLEDLQKKDTWPKLCGVALVAPDDDSLPYRSQYGAENEDGSLSVNIGINRIISACPAWFAFADIIASNILTGRTPKILKTLELYPIGQQHTNVIELFGDERYQVDLAKGEDFFASLINARIDVQNELKDPLAPTERKAFLKSFQNGLKLTANGTSYRVPNEFIVDDHLKEVPTTVYYGGGSAKVKARRHSIGEDGGVEISDYKAEKPGKYWGPWGGLIPAAGRLLLAIGERLAMDRKLVSAFDDTDSMAFAGYWRLYSQEEFRAKVKEITAWFQPLNPYKHDTPLFGFEDINFVEHDVVNPETGATEKKKEWEPLYCMAVSAKRYTLFNRGTDGAPIIRKSSAHGLGDVELPAGYQCRFEHTAAPWVDENGAPCEPSEKYELEPIVDDELDAAIAAVMEEDGYNEPADQQSGPRRNYRELVAGAAGALFLDMWYAAILELDEKGNLGGIDEVIGSWPELAVPQHSQTSLSTRDAWLKYQNLPNRRAFQFFETLPAPRIGVEETGASDNELMFAELKEAEKSSLYTAYSKPFELDFDNLYRRDTNELIKPYLDEGMRLTTVADRVRGYFAHGEAKSQGSVGLLERKCVAGLSKVWIGKESHPYADTEENPDDETLEAYKTGVAIVSKSLNHDLIARAGVAEVAKAARIDEQVLLDVVVNEKDLRADLKARLFKAIAVTPDGVIEVVTVPVTRLETDVERVRALIVKHKRVGLLGQFIHAAKALELRVKSHECLYAGASIEDRIKLDEQMLTTPNSGDWAGHDNTHKKIRQDLDRICALCPPVFLTINEIEGHARHFYGIEKGLKKRSDRKALQEKYFKSTAHKVRERVYNSRTRKRGNEIERVAALWGLPEITSTKSVKHARLTDKGLSQMGAPGEIIKIVSWPHFNAAPEQLIVRGE